MIYLDNAATSFPKPFTVGTALLDALISPLGNPGRGLHAASENSAEVVYRAREALSVFFGLDAPERVVLTKNATEAINLALLGLLDGEGERRGVIASVLEHNSVLRPLYELQRRGRIDLSLLDVGGSAAECVENFSHLLDKNPVSLVALTSRANTTGDPLPVSELARLAHRSGALVLLDVSQSAGHEPIGISKLDADYFCLPAHKGLLGITGLGALLIRPGAPLPKPLLFGGAGFDSKSTEMPGVLPERLEAGTVPVHACVALCAALEYLRRRGVEEIGAREGELSVLLSEGARELGYTVYGRADHGIVLFNWPGIHSEMLAEVLAAEGIAVRGGFHCAPLAHRFLGTQDQGAVRASFGAFNDREDVRKTLLALQRVRKEF